MDSAQTTRRVTTGEPPQTRRTHATNSELKLDTILRVTGLQRVEKRSPQHTNPNDNQSLAGSNRRCVERSVSL